MADKLWGQNWQTDVWLGDPTRKHFASAFRKGIRARLDGFGLNDCPYGDHRQTHRNSVTFSRAWARAWEDGWRFGHANDAAPEGS